MIYENWKHTDDSINGNHITNYMDTSSWTWVWNGEHWFHDLCIAMGRVIDQSSRCDKVLKEMTKKCMRRFILMTCI